MTKLKCGTSGVLFPPGVDVLAYWGQLNLITPHLIWTPELVPAADFVDILRERNMKPVPV